MVVDETLEEMVSKIIEFIEGFHTRIREFEVCTTLGTPLEENKQREITVVTLVASIKIMEEELGKVCEESTQLWKKLMEDPKMKFVEERLRNVLGVL
jgi:hypothetical protein